MGDKNVNTGNVNTGGGSFRIGDDYNFYQTIIINTTNNLEKYGSLINNTKNVLGKIGDSINGIKLDRKLLQPPLDYLFNKNQFISISGVAGSGKSFIAKQILEQLTDTCIISFPADQFLKNSLITALHDYNIENGIDDVFNTFSQYSKKIIYIDSFEKLLEGEAEAFKELMIFLKENQDIKLLLSCRDYAYDTLKFKFFLEQNVYEIKVPLLSETELEYFKSKIPVLKKISTNENLKEVLRVPKYLSLAVKLLSLSNADYTNINVIDFKKELWKYIIEGINQSDAIHLERAKTFIKITLKRAKNLTIVTSVNEFNSIAIKELFNEGVLFKEDDLYAPSHDIFEDWGLIKYLDNYFNEKNEIELFYNELGNEPAIRRGFRLWIEAKIEEKQNWIYDFVLETINNTKIENNWKDEVITAITKSDYCEQYFIDNDNNLKENDFSLLKRFIHLLKISGKNSEQVPNNDGWNVVIKYLYENLGILTSNYSLILKFLLEWKYIIYFGKIENKETPKYVAEILYKILGELEEEDSFTFGNNDNSLTSQAIKLLFQLSEYIPDKLKFLIDDLLEEHKDEKNYKVRNLREQKTKFALSHFYTGTLVKILPNELIALANKNWKIDKKEKHEFHSYSINEIENNFGLTSKHDFKYFPDSAYQTFVYNFLKEKPFIALDFIIDFINSATENYIKSDFLKEDGEFVTRDELHTIELLYNAKKYPLYGSNYLWSINRGGQIVVPNLLQSIVVALERFLYEHGSNNQEILKETIDNYLQNVFDKIYTKSNSVILLSVLSSIAMAFPNRVGNKFLPLFSSKYFFEWDFNRWFADLREGGDSFLSGYSRDAISKAIDKERKDANNWEHRIKMERGLEGLIIYFQFTIKNYNQEIFTYLDLMKVTIDESNLKEVRLLTEIDSRNWKNEKDIIVENRTYKLFSPDYSKNKELVEQMSINQEKQKLKENYNKIELWVIQTFQKKSKENQTYKFWKESYKYLKNTDLTLIEKITPFPIGTFCVIGFHNFHNELTKKEIIFCLDTILDLVERIYKRNQNRKDVLNMNLSISPFDGDAIYEILPLLLKYKTKIPNKKQEIIKAYIFAYLKEFNSHGDTDIKHFYKSFKNEFWEIDYKFAKSCFLGIMYFAQFNKKYPKHKHYTESELEAIGNEENDIYDSIENSNLPLRFNEIKYKEFSHWDIIKAIEIFPTKDTFDFSFQFLESIFEAQLVSFSYEKDSYRSTDYYDIGIKIKNVIAEFLLENEVTENSKQLFKKIIEFEKAENRNYKYNRDIDKYLFDCIQEFYCFVDSNQNENVLKHFWVYWNILLGNIKNRNDLYFSKEFLFYLDYWEQDANDCFMLKTNSQQYIQQINSLPKVHIETLLQLLSGIGFEKLVPQGISPLVKQIKKYPSTIEGNSYFYAEKLIMRCFNSKMKQIKSNKTLLLEFLFFLETMIDLGSSKAYYIRENVILYKKL